ncbi:cupin, partial [Kibdelosporangium lantanae]
AWAAPAEAAADVLVIFTPGIERFGYFRLGDRIRKGEAEPAEILATQERFDNHFVDSPIWRPASDVFPTRG